MSTAVYDDLIRFVLAEPDDELMAQRQKQTIRVFLDMAPEVKAEVIADAELAKDRAALRRVLARRKLPISAADQARIVACTDPATLERWHEQAVDAASAAEALR
jgi:hypothetical protein